MAWIILGTLLGRAASGIRQTVAHGVAEPDLDDLAGLLGNLHQFLDKRDDEPLEIRARDVFQMAADSVQSGLERGRHKVKVVDPSSGRESS